MSRSNSLKRKNNGLALTATLFLLIVAAGTASAFRGYTLGYESLKGINQPDSNPTKKINSKQKSDRKPQATVILSEKQILTEVDKFIQLQSEPKKNPQTQPKTDTQKDAKANERENQSFIKLPEQNKKANSQLPIKTTEQGVTLEIVGMTKQDGDLVIDVNLVNKSANKVQFLYSFLIIRNEENRLLSSVTEGLPEEISAGGDKVSGEVRIPLSLLGDSQKLSFELNDYPEEKIKLEIPKISIEGLSET
jgi:hypothetical protein